jgi:hypothetical protein
VSLWPIHPCPPPGEGVRCARAVLAAGEERVPQKDLHEKLLIPCESMLGRLPDRAELLEAHRASFSEEDARLVLLLPFRGKIPISRYVRKARKLRIEPDRVYDAVKRLVPEGIIASYIKPRGRAGRAYPAATPLLNLRHERRVVMRGDILSLTRRLTSKALLSFVTGGLRRRHSGKGPSGDASCTK